MPAGMSAISEKQLGEAEKKFKKYEAMIKSMTKEERQNPDLLATSSSRRRRIARGSGHKDAEVGELVAVFLGMRKQAGVLSKRMKMFGGDALDSMPKFIHKFPDPYLCVLCNNLQILRGWGSHESLYSIARFIKRSMSCKTAFLVLARCSWHVPRGYDERACRKLWPTTSFPWNGPPPDKEERRLQRQTSLEGQRLKGGSRTCLSKIDLSRQRNLLQFCSALPMQMVSIN